MWSQRSHERGRLQTGKNSQLGPVVLYRYKHQRHYQNDLHNSLYSKLLHDYWKYIPDKHNKHIIMHMYYVNSHFYVRLDKLSILNFASILLSVKINYISYTCICKRIIIYIYFWLFTNKNVLLVSCTSQFFVIVVNII